MKRNFTLAEAYEYHQQNPTASRDATIRDDFKIVQDHWSGIGPQVVHVATDEPCECKMKWNESGTVLLCPICLTNGT